MCGPLVSDDGSGGAVAAIREAVAAEGFTPLPFWPIKGPMGLCRGRSEHLAAYNMGPSALGLANFDDAGNLLQDTPADAWGCRNCHCGWLEPTARV